MVCLPSPAGNDCISPSIQSVFDLQSRHTILLAQFSPAATSRTYFDFETVKLAVERALLSPGPLFR